MVFEGELGSMEKSKRRVGVGCPHCIFCARGVVAVRIGTDLALHGRTLFGQLSWFSGRSQEKGSLVSLVVQQESLESSGGLGELLGILE